MLIDTQSGNESRAYPSYIPSSRRVCTPIAPAGFETSFSCLSCSLSAVSLIEHCRSHTFPPQILSFVPPHAPRLRRPKSARAPYSIGAQAIAEPRPAAASTEWEQRGQIRWCRVFFDDRMTVCDWRMDPAHHSPGPSARRGVRIVVSRVHSHSIWARLESHLCQNPRWG